MTISPHNLHSSHQSAYKQSFSTETALCILVNDVLWSIERAENTILVATDLSAAFDTVDHHILCSLLYKNFGIKDTALEWIRSYLKDRTLKVKILDSLSSPQSFNFSVPQGSCLGPVLFNTYVSTLTDCIPASLSVSGYADDHIIKGVFNPADASDTTSCVNMIQDTLISVHNWMSANRLRMNPSKTEVTIFGSQQQLKKHNITLINVAGDMIQLGKCIKYLGVHLDASLTFKDFISNKCKISITNIRNIFNIRNYINNDTAKQLASALVLSHLDYSNSVLCGLPMSALKPLQRVQNWAARVVLCRSKYDSARDALQQLHWLPVHERIDFKVACLVYKCVHNLAPANLSRLISSRPYARQTRASANACFELQVLKTKKSTFAARSFSVYGPLLWNDLPISIKTQTEFSSFKKHLKTHLFRRAFY